jgi:hypothetical protein
MASITQRPNLTNIVGGFLPNPIIYKLSTLNPSEEVDICNHLGVVLATLQYSAFGNEIVIDLGKVLYSFLDNTPTLPTSNEALVIDNNYFLRFYIKGSGFNDSSNIRYAFNARSTDLAFDYQKYSFLRSVPTPATTTVIFLNKLPLYFYKGFGMLACGAFVNPLVTDTLRVDRFSISTNFGNINGLFRFKTNLNELIQFTAIDVANVAYMATPNTIPQTECFERALFWVNSLGGIDSYPFLGYEKTYDTVTSNFYLPYPLRNDLVLEKGKKEVTTLTNIVSDTYIKAFCEVYTSKYVFMLEDNVLVPVVVRNEQQVIFENNRRKIFEMSVIVERYVNE